MEIFYKGESSEYEEIVKCGPNWWTEYLEMNAVYQFEGWTLDLMISWLNRMVSNQFPMHADEATIKFFEQLMMINPEPEESLEQRRETVFTYYSGINKLSKSVIQSIIKIHTGCNSELWWEEKTLCIRILCGSDRAYSVAKIVNAIERRLPAHIAIYIRIVLAAFEIGEKYKSRIKVRFPIHCKLPKLDNRIKHRMELKCGEGVMVSVIVRKDVWRLDGSYLLNGSALLNAYEKKEVL